MPTTNTYGRGFSGGSMMAAIQRLAALQDLDDEKDRLEGAAERQLISASLGAVPVIGGLLSNLEQSEQAFQQAGVSPVKRSFDAPRENRTQGFAATGAGGGVGGGVAGTGAALGDLSTLAAQEELDRARRRAESTQRLAALVGASGGVINTVASSVVPLISRGEQPQVPQPGSGTAANATSSIAPVPSQGVGPDTGGIGRGFTASLPTQFSPTSTGANIGIQPVLSQNIPDVPTAAMQEILLRQAPQRQTLGSILRDYFLRRR